LIFKLKIKILKNIFFNQLNETPIYELINGILYVNQESGILINYFNHEQYRYFRHRYGTLEEMSEYINIATNNVTDYTTLIIWK